MAKDVLGQILLTEQVWNRWLALVVAAEPLLRELLAEGLDLASIPDEQAEVLPDGRLRIHATLPDGTVLVELILPQEQWGWMQG